MTDPPTRRRPDPVSSRPVPDAGPDELPIGEAAHRLGVTTDAVRKRLRPDPRLAITGVAQRGRPHFRQVGDDDAPGTEEENDHAA